MKKLNFYKSALGDLDISIRPESKTPTSSTRSLRGKVT